MKCRTSGLTPDAAVVVVTVRALKVHSGRFKVVAGKPLPPELLEENPDDVAAGLANLAHHLDIVAAAGVPAVVAINAFPDDHPSEHAVIERFAHQRGVRVAIDPTRGRRGERERQDLVRAVLAATEEGSHLRYTYDLEDALADRQARRQPSSPPRSMARAAVVELRLRRRPS